ncbi:gliding motility-associated C-terminal domain-containing protein [Tangfeifania diversioriginum]|uniref:Gliding motility-associated C-terminal domain-containing protein n=1 Tax=Tangfeifania diversioriginum TaxID=1168035 RepID=A0A1M6G3S5_9BACT|nr:PKD domain-containing protein [Tangfeifania diversioriginum]SHJ04608.1 gliding motility-associated C-terminal domain-containing protein [Tangfeifania diversioriginum]
MRQRKLLFSAAVGILLLIAGFVHAQPEQTSRIDNSGADTVFYCNGLVPVAPGITIENIDFENSSDGIKISITNYKQGEDRLFYSETELTQNWDPIYGNLELTGAGTAEEYEAAVQQVYYEYLSNNPTPEPRSFSISLLDADYLPHTEHFYLYIEEKGIPWTEARDSAANMDYYGLQGYLATITSSIENEFIWTKIDGVVGWIGASDEEQEGTWKWVTGPELDSVFWQGNYNGYRVNGAYSYWNNGEPNNSNDEDYAHINDDDIGKKSWNDLPNEGGSGNYYPQGFVVEFGGMNGDPDVQLSASAVVAWNPKPVVEVNDFSKLMCGENTQQLQLQIPPNVSTVLRPISTGANVDDESSPEPVIQFPPGEYGTYGFRLEVIDEYDCSRFDTLEVSYQHQPTADFYLDEEECKGYNLQLDFEGEVLNDAQFSWYSNDTVFHSGLNESMEIPLGYGEPGRSVGLKVNENGCVDSTRIEVTVTPVIDFSAETPDGCNPLENRILSDSSEPIEEYFWDLGDGTTTEEKEPTHSFENTGTTDKKFDVSLRVVSAEGCENKGIKKDFITVHPIPAIDFDFEEDLCYSETAAVNYVGSAGEKDDFQWDLSDFESGEIVEDPGKSPGPLRFNLLNRPTASVGLKVISEFGCETEEIIKTYKRKPLFEVSGEPIEGCPPLDAEMEISTTDLVDEVNYSWNLGNGIQSEGNSFSRSFSESDKNYDVKITAVSSLTGCDDTLLLPGKIVVHPVPEADFNANPSSVLISNPVIQFENQTTGATEYSWNFGDESADSDEENPVHRFDEMDRYHVALRAFNDFGCSDSAFTDVSVTFDKVFPPNAFSPNAAKVEDREFRIHSEGIVNEGYKLLIFNRWGEVIFESNSQENGWDGTMKNGDFAPAGVYSWVIEYYDFLGEKHAQQGTVTLIF